MNHSETYIRTITSLATSSGRQPPITYAVLLEKGREFPNFAEPQPELRGLGQCYLNSYRFALENGLHYCEGYAVPSGIGLPFEHAWCCDDAGNVYDTTWADGSDYFGVALSLDAVETIMEKTGRYSVFGNLYMLRQDVEAIKQLLLDSVLEI